jgi:hypothetical protein
MLGGICMRLNGFLIGYDTGVGVDTRLDLLPVRAELLVTIGMFAVEVLGYIIITRRFPVLPREDAGLSNSNAQGFRRTTMSKRVTIDPVTRIEGHLRVDVEVEGGKVKKAWSSGQMWRGVENILIGRDPRDAWAITQRICGVCTTVHAVASVRAVENALQPGDSGQCPVHPQPDHPGARRA